MATNRRRTLPQVSPKVSAELRPMVTAIKEIIETGEGVRGDPLDRKLTFRDLVDGGIIKIKTMPIGGNPGTLEPGDGTPDLSTPPQPTGFNAYGGFDGRIDLTWTIPGSLYSNHAYTNVYRAEEDNFANAILVGREAGSFYTDVVRDDAAPKPYYYWISFTSLADIEGPLNSPNGTMAQALLDPDYIIEQIEGRISESELANELLAPIQAIPSIQSTLGSHDARLNSAEAQLADLLNVAEYDPAVSYVIDDLATYNGSTWRALTNMAAPAPTPVEGADWTKVGDYESFAGQITANTVAISDLDFRVTGNEGTISSYATDISNLQTRVTDTENATTGNSQANSALESRVTTAEGNISTNSSDITILKTDVLNAEGGISGNSSAINSLDSRVTTVEGDVLANSSDITLLENGLTTTQGDVSANSNALSLLDSRVQTAEGTITANSSDITQLQVDVQNLDPTGSAQAIQDLDVRVTANETSITAVSSDVTTLEASVNGNTSALQTKAEVSAVQDIENDITVLSAQYTVKLDVNGRVAGIGLANVNGVSEFIVASDAVYFIDPGQSIEPFNPNANYSSMTDVRDTQLVFGYAEVEGHKRFVINAPAYIPEGYIESGMVGAISFGKITTDAGVPVTTVSGKLKADYIDVDNLSVAEAATFYGNAQSGNYVGGTSGWKLWQNGNLEAYNATVRGRIEAESGYIASTLQIGGTADSLADIRNFALAADSKARTFSGTSNPLFANPPAQEGDLWFRPQDSSTRRLTNGLWDKIGDVTFNNDARDVRSVNGVPATEVSAGASRAINWTRPNSTLIDGNKIFTGDAYVDTLQIKGQAVTFATSAYTAGEVSINSTGVFQTVQSVAMPTTGAPIIIWGSVSGRYLTDDAQIRIRRGGSVVYQAQIFGAGDASTNNGILPPTTVCALVSNPGSSSSQTFYLDVESDRTNVRIRTRSLTLFEAKR